MPPRLLYITNEHKLQFDDALKWLVLDLDLQTNPAAYKLSVCKEVVIDFLLKNQLTFLYNAFYVYHKQKFEYLTFYEFLVQFYFVSYWLDITGSTSDTLYFSIGDLPKDRLQFNIRIEHEL